MAPGGSCGGRDAAGSTPPPRPTTATSDGPLSLPASRRLDAAGFRATFDNDTTRAGRHMVMWLRDTGDAPGRLGVIATKRIFRRAVDRNRARRLLRETYRLNRPRLKQGVDLILLARRPIIEARQPEVAAEFEKLCRKARIWSAPP